jgi:hypothetical protein
MKELFQHKITNSMLLWFDNYFLTHADGYINRTGTFFYEEDPSLPANLKSFNSRYKQWVNDSSITGANIPSGVFIDGAFSGRADGVILDFENGRALVDSSVPNTATITGAFAVKDINVYYTDDDEEDIINEQRYQVNPNLPAAEQSAQTGLSPYDFAIPAAFIANQGLNNKGFALGGLEETTVRFTAVVLAQNSFELDGVLSVFADSKNEIIPEIPMTGAPSTEWGDIKNDSYSFVGGRSYYLQNGHYFVNSVGTSKLTDRARRGLQSNLYIGFIDFEVQQHRYRHQ